MADFLSELRTLAEFCEFEDNLDIMLRDRLICGISDNSMQRRLLAEGDKLSLPETLKLAQAVQTLVSAFSFVAIINTSKMMIMELADKDSQPRTKQCTGWARIQ